MERAARGAGAVAAPNSSLAIGLGLGGGFLAVGFLAGFCTALSGAGAACIAAVWAAAGSAPHNRISVRPKVSLRIRYLTFPVDPPGPKPSTNDGGNWNAAAIEIVPQDRSIQ